jgi:tRNA pseudouridine38-40 synthase
MQRYKLTIAYDGTGFVGWQRQAVGPSIQGQLEDALSELDGRPVSVTGAGRTDAGVHACAQVAHVALERKMDPPALARAVNVRLPPSIRILDAVRAASAFHARFDARAKGYRYRVWNADVLSPFERFYGWHVALPRLDVDAMAQAAGTLEGRHDFAAFKGTGSEAHRTVRTVFSSRIRTDVPVLIHGGPEGPLSSSGSSSQRTKPDRRRADLPVRAGALIVYEISGDGFLRHMVRNIVGSLVEVGRGRRPAGWMREVLESGDRTRAGPTAPAEGLFLVGVEYGRTDPR